MAGVHTKWALRSLFLASVALPGFAFAADTQPPPSSASVTELVVTAEKREEPLQNIPVSVTAIPGRNLEQLQALDLEDWAGLVPGLVVGDAGAPGESIVTIDGIAPIGAASEVGVYLGDTAVGSSSSFQQAATYTMDLMPYDLDHVEVLRGPQGTLYGASTMGGLIKYVLTAPDPTHFSGRVGGDLFGVENGSSVGGGVRAEANMPLVSDTLALRVSGYDENTPGYIDDVTTGQKGDNAVRQYGGRAALLWKPTGDVSVQFEALYQATHADNQAFAALDPTTLQPIAGSLTNINARQEPYSQELQLYDLTLNWNLHWAQLTSVSSYQRFNNDAVEDSTLLFGPSDLNGNYKLQKYSEEVRLASPTGQPLVWLVGGYYTHEAGAFSQIISLYEPDGSLIPGENPFEFVDLPSTYQEYAFFGDVTYHFGDKFDLSGGVRYAHNNQSFAESEGGAALGSDPVTAPVIVLPGSSSEGVTTFSVAPEWHVTKDVMAYARIASGYQPGGPNLVIPGPGSSSVPPTFQSSTLIDYQLGVKASFLDGRASVDLSAFEIDWTKIQITVLIGDQSPLENGGRARSDGFDFSGSYSPIEGLTLGATLSYTNAVLTEPIPSLGTLAGARLPYVPLWSGSLTADYSVPIAGPWRGFIGGDYRPIGSRFSVVQGSASAGATGLVPVGADNVVDLHFGVRTHDLTLSVFAKNLFNEHAFLPPEVDFFNLVVTAPVLQPTTVGVSIDKSF
ncbi:MAG TPA: TonB-dependent receptor [Caulobacteraceae bacterium]|nr:TonB-dependent receptor [Caulobacteraceae bacterium]